MKELFYIGDSEVDADCAQRAGVESAILTFGMRSAKYLIEHGVNPDVLVCSMDEAAKRAKLYTTV
ncbi:MAG: HAD hydrolase-like protein [Spirochaetales bacterium]|nr:HAD hydrolase-like protein [Spirochaetales bacterium]